MKSRRLLLALPLLLVACTSSRRLIRPLDAPVGVASVVDVAQLEKTYQRFEGVYLDHQTTFEHVVEGGLMRQWSFVETNARSYVVLRPESEALTTFKLTVPAGHVLEKPVLWMKKPDGTERRWGESDLRVERDSNGETTYKLAYPDVVVGTIISESWSVEQPPNEMKSLPLRTAAPLQFHMPCLRLSFSYLYPDWWEVQAKSLAPGRPLPVEKIQRENSKTELRYLATDVPALVDEHDQPFEREMAAWAVIELHHTRLGLRHLDLPRTWQELANVYSRYALDKDPLVADRLRQLARGLVAGSKSEMERLQAIHGWVQKNIEVGKHQGADFADIIEWRHGGALEVAGLTRSLLQKVGIDTDFVLIHTGFLGHFDPAFVSEDELGIPALWGRADGKRFLLLPHLKGMPVDIMPEEFRGQSALAIRGDGTSSLISLDAGDDRAESVAEFEATLTEDGRLHVREERTYRGLVAWHLRKHLRGAGADELGALFHADAAGVDGERKLRIQTLEDGGRESVHLVFEYDLDDVVSMAPDEVVLRAADLFAPSLRLRPQDELRERRTPVAIHFGEAERRVVRLHYPAGWTLQTQLSGFVTENRFGHAEGRFRSEEGRLVGEHSLALKVSSGPSTSYAEFLELVGSRSRFRVPALVFRRAR